MPGPIIGGGIMPGGCIMGEGIMDGRMPRR